MGDVSISNGPPSLAGSWSVSGIGSLVLVAPSRPKDERRSNVGEDQNSRVSIRASCHSQPDLKTTFKLLSDQTLAPLRHTKAHSALRDLKNVPVEHFLATQRLHF